MKIHVLSLLFLFFTSNSLSAQNDKKLAKATFLSLYLNENDKSSEYFYINLELTLSSLCKMRKKDTVSIYLKNKTNIILLQRHIYWNNSQMNDTTLLFKISGCFMMDSNFIQKNYYRIRCEGGLYFPNENDNKSVVKYQHYLDTIEIPIGELNYAMQMVHTESIGFIQYEANSDLRFNHTSIISGEKEWTITNNMGRIVQRGYLDAIKGDNSYTIQIYDLPKGNYTLEIGERSNAVNESFVVR